MTPDMGGRLLACRSGGASPGYKPITLQKYSYLRYRTKCPSP